MTTGGFTNNGPARRLLRNLTPTGIWTPEDYRTAPIGPADPFFSSVTGLWHFGPPPGQTPLTNRIFWNECQNPVYDLYPSDGATLDPSTLLYEETALDMTNSNNGWVSHLMGGGDGGASGSGPSDFGTGDFAIEYYFYPTQVASTRAILDMRPNSTPAAKPVMYILATGVLNYFTANALRIASAASTVSANTWAYASYVRDSGTGRLYYGTVAGGTATSVGSWADSTNYNGTGTIYLSTLFNSGTGAASSPGAMLFDSFRITKGNSRGYNGASYTIPGQFPSF